MSTELVTTVSIERSIRLVRGQKVLLDADLAHLYGVSAKRLNEQVRRNMEGFPDDFMFRLDAEEAANLRSQIATSSSWGGRRYQPMAFTEPHNGGFGSLRSQFATLKSSGLHVQPSAPASLAEPSGLGGPRVRR